MSIHLRQASGDVKLYPNYMVQLGEAIENRNNMKGPECTADISPLRRKKKKEKSQTSDLICHQQNSCCVSIVLGFVFFALTLQMM